MSLKEERSKAREMDKEMDREKQRQRESVCAVLHVNPVLCYSCFVPLCICVCTCLHVYALCSCSYVYHSSTVVFNNKNYRITDDKIPSASYFELENRAVGLN